MHQTLCRRLYQQFSVSFWHRRRSGSRFALTVLFWLLGPAAIVARAQDKSYLTTIGVLPWTTTIPVEHGYINVANGDLHLKIPLGSFPQRGARDFEVSLFYDSRIWREPSVTSGWP
jgi:hypothetical protein